LNNEKRIIAVVVMAVILITACSLLPSEPDSVAGSYSDLDNNKVVEGIIPPDFTLIDGSGETVQLSSVLKESHVLLLFYRGD